MVEWECCVGSGATLAQQSNVGNEANVGVDGEEARIMWLSVVLFFVGVMLIARGGGWFADGAVGLATRTGISKVIIGATVMSVATTLPETTVAIVAALGGRVDTVVGNAVGSNIVNVAFILALGVLINPLRSRQVDRSPLLFYLASIPLLMVFAWNHLVGAGEALVLLAVGIAFLVWQVRTIRRGYRLHQQEGFLGGEVGESAATHADGVPGSVSLARTLLLFAGGAIAVLGGSSLVVHHGVELAAFLGVPERIIALTLVSIGTSLPELVTAVSAARRGHTDLVAGNILGANLFNITLGLPIAALIHPLVIDPKILRLDVPAMAIVAAVAAFALLRRRVTMPRSLAFLLLSLYGLYLWVLFTAM